MLIHLRVLQFHTLTGVFGFSRAHLKLRVFFIKLQLRIAEIQYDGVNSSIV